mgnify:CR=1 FL=1
MVVVRDEVFDAKGIKRLNRERLQKEQMAQQSRAQRPAQSRRVDTAQPMYQKPRPSHGGGALDFGYLLLLVPLFWYMSRNRSELKDVS